jgi:hypothetical protein
VHINNLSKYVLGIGNKKLDIQFGDESLDGQLLTATVDQQIIVIVLYYEIKIYDNFMFLYNFGNWNLQEHE